MSATRVLGSWSPWVEVSWSGPQAIEARPARPLASLAEASASERVAMMDALAWAQQTLGPRARVRLEDHPALHWRVERPQADPGDDALESTRIWAGVGRRPLLDALLPLMLRAQRIDILAAFVMPSGVTLLAPHLGAALARGAQVRVLTGDYLRLTRHEALASLLALARASALSHAPAPEGMIAPDDAWMGRLQIGAVCMEALPQAASFHPKSWIFRAEQDGQAFVGSSNLSRAALLTGVEWNMRLARHEDPAGFDAVLAEFEALWGLAQPVDEPWLRRYAQLQRQDDAARPDARPDARHDDPRARLDATHAPALSALLEPAAPDAPTPHELQRQALEALALARQRGQTRALVVMATGLGKTWLAAFDLMAFEAARQRPARVLFVAHRVELLRQAAQTFARALPGRSIGFIVGSQDELDAQLTFASVQKLSRQQTLQRLDASRFDYVILDEVHHALAPSYQVIMTWCSPGFMLGLTATPQRGDAQDVASLFGGSPVFEASLVEGITRQALVPFHYFGSPDVIDYDALPKVAGGLDHQALSRAAQHQARDEAMWLAWREHPGTRTLVFCVSVEHAQWTAQRLSERGVRARALHAQSPLQERAWALEALQIGQLDALCAVDLLNEGVDLPAVDRVIMLRPTASGVVFLQQLGRGLRLSPETGKSALVVLDFVGNHQIFLERLDALLSLSSLPGGQLPQEGAPGEPLGSPGAPSLAQRLAALPPGCVVHLELEVIQVLEQLRQRARPALVSAYLSMRQRLGRRPSAGDMTRHRLSLTGARALGGWFGLVQAQGDLSEREALALALSPSWWQALQAPGLSDAALRALRDALREPWRQGWSSALPERLRLAASAKALAAQDEPTRQAWLGMSLELVEAELERRRQRDAAVSSAPALTLTSSELDAMGAWVPVCAPGDLLDYDLVRLSHGPKPEPGARVWIAALHEPGRWIVHDEGVWDEEAGGWRTSALSYAQWRDFAPPGRKARPSRRLDPALLEWARAFAARYMADELRGQLLHARGRTLRVLEVSDEGTIRLDGGADGLRPRRVTSTDLAWVLYARAWARDQGLAYVDQGLVHSLRYLPSTPEGSTRYIDTGWALALVEALLGP